MRRPEPSFCPPRVPGAPRIRFLANAGVLLECGGKKVLVDALCGGVQPLFPAMPASMERAVLEGCAPYEAIDLFCVTHAHPDHFLPEKVAAFALRRPRVPILGCAAVMAALAPLVGRAAALTHTHPSPGASVSRVFDGIEVTAVSLAHEGRQYENVTNLAYVVRMGGCVFTHTGDAACTPENLDALAAAGARGSILVAPFPYLTLPSAFSRTWSVLSPAALLALHLPRPESDAGGWIRAARRAVERRSRVYACLELAETQGQLFTFSS